MGIRFGVSLVIVAVLIGITALFTNNGNDDKSSTPPSTSAADTTTPTSAVPAALPAGCVDTVPPANPNRPTFKDAPPMTIDRGQDLHRQALDELW